jgi:1-acyl-sn-glycerol-3-phosphate acyltransferase
MPARKNRFYDFIVWLAIRLMRLMRWDVKVRGVENLPETGPAILAANHVGFLDFIFIGYVAKFRHRLVRFLSQKIAFTHRISGPLMRAMRHIPVDRDKDPTLAFRYAIEALREGEVIGLHPEGRMNTTFTIEGMKTGAARMALDTGAPLIPVAVWGSQRIWTKTHRKLLQRKVPLEVSYGKPIKPRKGETPQQLTRRLGKAIERLLPAEALAAAA